MRKSVRWLISLGGVSLGVALGTWTAFACIPIAMLNLSPSEATPGSTVTATIIQIAGADAPPVTFHWQSVDGPILAVAQPTEKGTQATFTVPEVSKAGDYLVVATQPLRAGRQTWGMPARAVLHVVTPGGGPVVPAAGGTTIPARPAGLVTDPGIGIGGLALIALAVAGAGLMLVGVATWAVSRGQGTPQTEVVRPDR